MIIGHHLHTLLLQQSYTLYSLDKLEPVKHRLRSLSEIRLSLHPSKLLGEIHIRILAASMQQVGWNCILANIGRDEELSYVYETVNFLLSQGGCHATVVGFDESVNKVDSILPWR